MFDFIPSFTSTAFAQEANPAAQAPGMMGQVFLFGMIFFIFYFLVIRPNSKKEKSTKEMLSTLKKGDEVITSSGILGHVHKVEDDKEFLSLEIADKVIVKVQKKQIAEKIILKPAKTKDN